MMYYTHLIFAFLAGLLGIKLFHPSNQILFMVLVLFSGLLPDIDHPKSKLGRYFRPLNFFISHRGIFHSLMILPVISLLLYYFNYSYLSLPIIVGYISHLIGDAITKEGIMPLYPVSKMRINGFISVGGFLEKILFIGLVLLSGYFLFAF